MNPLRIYFSCFWNGFVEGRGAVSVHFFVELFKRIFGSEIIVENDLNCADVLCENAWPINGSVIYMKKWKYAILYTGESVISFGELSDHKYSHYQHFSCFLSGLDENKELKRIICPYFLPYLYCNRTLSMEPIQSVPKEMVCAIISNPKGKVRNRFLDRLESKMHVSYGGQFRNNIGYQVIGDYNSFDLINFMKRFKFVITMENNEEDYYITEKICNGFIAGTIPIYWGSPNVSKYVNSNRFLHLINDSDKEMDYIIEKMITISDETYLKMVNSPIFINDMDTMINNVVQNTKSVLF